MAAWKRPVGRNAPRNRPPGGKYRSHGCATVTNWGNWTYSPNRPYCAMKIVKETAKTRLRNTPRWQKTACETARFALQNGLFRTLRRVVSQCKTTRLRMQGDKRRHVMRQKRPCNFYFANSSRVKPGRPKCKIRSVKLSLRFSESV